MKIDQIIRSKRKTISIIIQRDGRLVVRAPLKAGNKQIIEFVDKKSDWIKSKQELVQTTYPKPTPKEFVNGEGFWYLGKIYPLEIVDAAKKSLVLKDLFLLDKASVATAQLVFIDWYRKQAAQILTERTSWLAGKYGFHYQRVKITSAQTRWGSCSLKGSLCFPWRLVMAPMSVIDYVVIHELVHTQEHNHRKAFWDKVIAIIPDYKNKIEWLKINSNLLCL